MLVEAQHNYMEENKEESKGLAHLLGWIKFVIPSGVIGKDNRESVFKARMMENSMRRVQSEAKLMS